MHGYVVCINFLVVELLSNVYNPTPFACVLYLYLDMYQQHLCPHCPNTV